MSRSTLELYLSKMSCQMLTVLRVTDVRFSWSFKARETTEKDKNLRQERVKILSVFSCTNDMYFTVQCT